MEYATCMIEGYSGAPIDPCRERACSSGFPGVISFIYRTVVAPRQRPAGILLILLILLPSLIWCQFPLQIKDSSTSGLLYRTGNFDINLLDKINPDTPRSVFFRQVSNSAYWLPAAIVVGELGYGFAADDPLSKRYAVETGVTVGIGQLMSIGLKHLINRPRPFVQYGERIHPVNYGTGPSFPSGHTTLAFSTAASLALARKQWTVTLPISLWAGSVGYSRMYLGRHFPTDVLGGMVVGAISGIIGHWVTGRIYGD